MAFYDDFNEPKKESKVITKGTGNKFGKYVRSQLEYSGMPKRLINIIEPLAPAYDDCSLRIGRSSALKNEKFQATFTSTA
ncbi:hypothetical protein CG98_gp141 [Enterobacter phage PG7]|uniref:Uncharacterized protein n=1 Tax=Enterobacter phage PG7 TaxID=1455074 RepID=W6AUG8_9CAUD|nr:hypothetical protein CG98_gp141 [Enterobacter phage PG7]AHI61044.1 hypothetical protein PG7_141 [Enterobacter phage PG7]